LILKTQEESGRTMLGESGREPSTPSLGYLDEPGVESREEPGRESKRASVGSQEEPGISTGSLEEPGKGVQ
jgi:hypothetical protein